MFYIFHNKNIFLDFIYLFSEGGAKGGQREGEKHQCVRETLISCLSYAPQPGHGPTTQACALTRNRTSDLSLCGTILNQPRAMLVRATQTLLERKQKVFSGKNIFRIIYLITAFEMY